MKTLFITLFSLIVNAAGVHSINLGGGSGSGGVTSVTASSPLASSGGATPNISLTGIVPILNGGTGQSTANAALNALLPSQATNAGKVLGTDGTNTSWVSSSSPTGDPNSVAFFNGTGALDDDPNVGYYPAISQTFPPFPSADTRGFYADSDAINVQQSGFIFGSTDTATDSFTENLGVITGANTTVGASNSTGGIVIFTGAVTDATSTANTGAVNISSGNSAGNASGGVSINSGQVNDGPSGSIFVQSGQAFGSGGSGAMQFSSGPANTGPSGIVQLGSGNSTASTSGNVSLVSGNSAQTSGSFEAKTGDVSWSGFSSGNLTLASGTTDDTTSGGLFLASGFSTSGNSGNLSFQSGTVGGSGNSGTVFIGSGVADSGNSGGVALFSGASTSGNTGFASLATSPSSTGSSGDASVRTGDITDPGASSGSGDIGLTTGSNSGTGDSGDILINAGSVTSGIQGSLVATVRTLNIVEGHLKFTQTTDPVAVADANAGTDAAASADGSDDRFRINLTTGSAAWASGVQLTVTFDKPFDSEPVCVAFPRNANAAQAALNVYIGAGSSDMTINFVNADVAATSYAWDVHCDEFGN